ncbi:MAG: DUF1295 domain-containing protein [Candidatus Cloacimonetes bacterium]|nr:DUF1295 domain-containing protein [Candidatus Cloacimonadota bacterium]
MIQHLLYAGLSLLIYFTLLFFLAIFRKNNAIADVVWGSGFVLLVLYQYVTMSQVGVRFILLSIMIFIWAFRLSLYIFLRSRKQAEDFRYAAWRKQWGKNWILYSYVKVFLIQAIFLFIISAPILIFYFSSNSALNWLDFVGFFIWSLGFILESVSDFQKNRFRKDSSNKGKFIQSGLWRYSRHPNYFGESLLWWGIFLVSLSLKNGIYAIISPIIITFLLTKVSGIPLLEKKYENNPEYSEYKNRTSAFVPWVRKDRG